MQKNTWITENKEKPKGNITIKKNKRQNSKNNEQKFKTEEWETKTTNSKNEK